ncbi:MAG: respiratory nitrate reductase subunit gamma [Bdellovibrionales bacterium]|nr:respiratory nitrate reductase subunit gamma [Bdellovibrionales bacterium]
MDFWFVVFPYIAFSVFVVGGAYRYKVTAFKYSSLSSQFLESRSLFWGSVPFHIGILGLFFGHLAAFLIPGAILAWNGEPVRLLVLEVSALAFALCALWGIVLLYVRRISDARVLAVSNRMDLLLEMVLLAQILIGITVALNHRWGSSWFASTLSPYLWSLVALRPDAEAVRSLPPLVQIHIAGAFLILLMIPFTRLVHFLVAPLHYIGRPYQRVMWNWDKRRVRDGNNGWSVTRPKNT